MKADTFLNAVGMIDERFLDIEVPQKRIVKRSTKRIIAVAAAAALVIFPLPTLTAFGVDPAYDVLYDVAPSVAQTFKPVRRSCTDQGIEMTVISAERAGSKVSVYLAMHDTTGNCPEGTWDLNDSYCINVSRNIVGHCAFSEYDAETQTAYFVVQLETMDSSDMPNRKITFSVREILQGKVHLSGNIEGIDMGRIPYEPQTVSRTDIRGGSAYQELPDPQDYRFLLPSEQALYCPANGIFVENIGYIDGALHILTKYEDIHHTDNHGYIELLGADVSEQDVFGFSYWDDAQTDSYEEQIIPVDYDKLANCSLYGEFWSASAFVSGNWQITFPPD